MNVKGFTLKPSTPGVFVKNIFLILAVMVAAVTNAKEMSLSNCGELISEQLQASGIGATPGDILKIPNSVIRNEKQLKYLCENDASIFNSLVFTPKPGGAITVAEKIAIADYTISGKMSTVAEEGARFITPKSGLYYRGSKDSRLSKSKPGDIIKLDRTTSVSKSKDVALGFMNFENAQLLIIKAKTAHPIDSFSQNRPEGVSEVESLLLIGTQLKVIESKMQKIFTVDFEGKEVLLNAQVIELEEII